LLNAWRLGAEPAMTVLPCALRRFSTSAVVIAPSSTTYKIALTDEETCHANPTTEPQPKRAPASQRLCPRRARTGNADHRRHDSTGLQRSGNSAATSAQA